MPNLKKQIMDLKWLLERSSDIVSNAQLDRMKETLLKANYDERYGDNTSSANVPEDMEGLTVMGEDDMGIDPSDDPASAYLSPSQDISGLDPIDAPEEQQEVSSPAPRQKKIKSQEQDGLHQIHHDEEYRGRLQDYAKEYLKGEYSKIIRDAQASDNPDKATTGHAYHLANPQHGLDLTRKVEELQNDPDHQKLSPREQHQQLAQLQADHFEENPNHKDEFVASGRERNEYAQAAKQVRSDKRAGEREDIGRGGTTATTDMSGASSEQAGQAIGAASTEQGTQANIQQTAESRIASRNRTASQIYSQEAEKKKLMDMMAHNAEHGADDPNHSKRQERMKGIAPADAQRIIEQTATKMDEKREESTKQAVEQRGSGMATTSSHPKEQLAGEYIPKMNSMAAKMLKQYGNVASDIKPGDLSRQGSQGLWEAVRDFDPQIHNFKGLAARRIKARMRDELQKQVNVSKPTQQDVRRLEDARRVLEEQEKTKEGNE
jgi:hypothetical protein